MARPAPDRLHRIAREERARRKAAWQRAGMGLSDRAMQDDIVWSNIEHMAARFAGDPAALKTAPHYWTAVERETMLRNARATLEKAAATLDTTVPANREKIGGLYHLYNWLRWPEPYRPAAIKADRKAA